MSLESKITEDLKTAMKAKDQAALRGIRAIKAALLLVKTDGSGEAVDEAKELKILQKLVKQRKDSLEIFETQKREDLAVIEREEISVISKYLPQQLSEEEIGAIVAQVVADTGAVGMKDMGRVMGLASKKLAGKADNKMVAAIVKSTLS